MRSSVVAFLCCLMLCIEFSTSHAAPLPLNSKDKLKPLTIESSWGPERGPDGKTTSRAIALIPQKIVDVIFNDVKKWYAKDYPMGARQHLLQLVKKKITGRGPAAWFKLQRTPEGGLQVSDPKTGNNYSLTGGKESSFELGVWQAPPKKPEVALKNGYRWQLSWMAQIGSGKDRHRYQVNVELTGKVDEFSVGINYHAIWKGPYKVEPIDFKTLRKR